jgi:hypothetical protein
MIRPASRIKGATVNLDGERFAPLAEFGHFHVAAFTEWQRAEKHLRNFADRHDFATAGGATDVFLIVNDRVTSRQVHKMTEPWWWGPNRRNLRKRAPREFIEAHVVQPDGEEFDVLGFHGSPGGWMGALFRTGGKNKAANREGARFVRDWIKAHPNGVAIGDFNLTRREVKKHITHRYAKTGKVDGMAWGSNFRFEQKRTYGMFPGHGAGKVTARLR